MPKRATKVCYKFFGENLFKLRIENKLTQQQVADKLGVTRPTYSKWETNVAEPPIYFIKRLAEILSTDYNTLFKQDESNA